MMCVQQRGPQNFRRVQMLSQQKAAVCICQPDVSGEGWEKRGVWFPVRVLTVGPIHIL